jgi:hypothetical protein
MTIDKMKKQYRKVPENAVVCHDGIYRDVSRPPVKKITAEYLKNRCLLVEKFTDIKKETLKLPEGTVEKSGRACCCTVVPSKTHQMLMPMNDRQRANPLDLMI